MFRERERRCCILMYINRFGWIMRNICCNFIDYHGYCGIARVWIQIFATKFPRKKCVSNNMLHILSVLFQFVYGIWNSFHVMCSEISGLRSNSNTPQSTFIDLSLPFYTRVRALISHTHQPFLPPWMRYAYSDHYTRLFNIHLNDAYLIWIQIEHLLVKF